MNPYWTITVKKRLSLTLRNNYDDTLLHLAVSGKQPLIVEKLLKKGLKVNDVNEDGDTALHAVVWEKVIKNNQDDALAVIKLLFENGIKRIAKTIKE
ncbi:MAG: ankyrin repeat domain-containing protein [Spirochaetales bacterium]|nr:ankyrin repeat domain-containing protein [Spirochaetales bacterium]